MQLKDKIHSFLRGEEFDHLDDLVALGGEAVPILLDVARQSPDEMSRARAVEALGRIGDRRALPVIEDCLRSGSSLEKLTAVRALARTAGADSVATLAPLLDDPDLSLVKVVVRSLAEVGDAAALAALERVKEQPAHDFLRKEAVAAIDTIKDRIA
jgi:HEAT repeat protein